MKQKDVLIACSAILIPIVITVGVMLLTDKYGYKKVTHSGITYEGKKPNPEICEHPDGIDLSHYNVAYDWSKVDTKFVYVRATMGNRIKDKQYDIHRKAAERHKTVYHPSIL